MAAEIAAPLSQAKKVTMISSGNGEVGAAKLTGEVLSIMEKLPTVVQNMTGVDIRQVNSAAIQYTIIKTIVDVRQWLQLKCIDM